MKKLTIFLFLLVVAAAVSAQGLLNRRRLSSRPLTPAAAREMANPANADRVMNAGRPAPSAASSAADPAESAAAAGESSMVDGEESAADPKEAPALNWEGAPVDIVLQTYGEQIGKTVLKAPDVPNATITLKSREGQKLTKEEYLEAIIVVLEMNNIHIEPYGENFVRAISRGKSRKDGIPLYMDIKDVPAETMDGFVVSVMIPFKSIAIAEAQKALEGFKSDSGVLNVFERTNAILVTDTWQNIKRMNEIAGAIDISTPVMENVFVRQIVHAAAQDVQTHLQKIVEESMKEQEKDGKGVQNNSANQAMRRPFIGANRLLGGNRNQQPEPPKSAESIVTSISDADRGMIRGKVLIVADERSNKLIVVTSKANMDFFDKVIEQLDVETTPDVKVEVIRLKYADAEEVSDMINDLIGNASNSKNQKGSQNPASKNAGPSKVNTTTGSSTPARASANQRSGESKAGELSKDNVTVLADKRINGLVIMARSQDFPTLHQIIEAMDVKLSQVLIETCILEVTLSDTIKTGIDWVHKVKRNGGLTQALSGGGGSTSMGGKLQQIATDGAQAALIPSGAGLNYMALSSKLDLGAVIEASKIDSNTKYLASPVIMTVDNKEATIEATQMRYLLTGFTSSGTSYSTIAVPNYEQKEIGITIKTTPKINPNGTVMLTIEEEYSQVVEKGQSIKTNTGMTGSDGKSSGLQDVPVDTTITRKMSADISLENNQTVVLGGLTENKVSKSETGIPILKDIPWIGRYLFGDTQDIEERKELLVFMTPYVLDDADAAQAEAIRRKQTLSESRPWEDHGWSKSKLADPVSTKEKLRRQAEEWKKQDKEYAAQLEMEKAQGERVKELEKRAQERTLERARDAAAIAEEFNAAEEKAAKERAEKDLEVRTNNAELLERLGDESRATEAK